MAHTPILSPEAAQLPRNSRGHFKKKAIPAEVRRQIAVRHGCRPGQSVAIECHYCGKQGRVHWFVQPTDRGPGWVAFAGLEMDHVKPELLGGTSHADNIVLACRTCNRSKSCKPLDQWRAA